MCSRYLIGDGTFEALKEGFFEILDEEGEDFFLPFLNLRGDIRPSMAAPVLLRETVGRKVWRTEGGLAAAGQVVITAGSA